MLVSLGQQRLEVGGLHLVVQIYNSKPNYRVHAVPFISLSPLLSVLTKVAFISSCSIKVNLFFSSISGVFDSIVTVYREEGILGFFAWVSLLFFICVDMNEWISLYTCVHVSTSCRPGASSQKSGLLNSELEPKLRLAQLWTVRLSNSFFDKPAFWNGPLGYAPILDIGF